jgi:hypothetical protein
MEPTFILLLFVLVLSIFLGFELISKVPSTLHTPLMPEIALAPDINGVCKVEGTFEINSKPKKIDKTNTNNNKINVGSIWFLSFICLVDRLIPQSEK